jgi:hypothetical protein
LIECCHGGAADPKHVSTGAMKLISVAAWQKLQGLFGGGPELLATGCVECADAEWEKGQQEIAREALKTALASALKSDEKKNAKGGDGGMPQDGHYYYVPRLLASNWKRWLGEGQRHATRELFCQHGKLLRLEAHARTIGADAWEHLFALFPDSIPLPIEAVSEVDGEQCRLVECADCMMSECNREVKKKNAKLSAKSEIASRLAQRQRLGRLLHSCCRRMGGFPKTSYVLRGNSTSWMAHGSPNGVLPCNPPPYPCLARHASPSAARAMASCSFDLSCVCATGWGFCLEAHPLKAPVESAAAAVVRSAAVRSSETSN